MKPRVDSRLSSHELGLVLEQPELEIPREWRDGWMDGMGSSSSRRCKSSSLEAPAHGAGAGEQHPQADQELPVNPNPLEPGTATRGQEGWWDRPGSHRAGMVDLRDLPQARSLPWDGTFQGPVPRPGGGCCIHWDGLGWAGMCPGGASPRHRDRIHTEGPRSAGDGWSSRGRPGPRAGRVPRIPGTSEATLRRHPVPEPVPIPDPTQGMATDGGKPAPVTPEQLKLGPH